MHEPRPEYHDPGALPPSHHNCRCQLLSMEALVPSGWALTVCEIRALPDVPHPKGAE